MPCPKVESRPLAWPRVAVLALVGVAAAGCSDSARFNSSSYTTDRPPQNVAAATPTYSAAGRVEAQPLPAPSQPATVAAAPAPTYTPAAYTPSSGGYHSNAQYSDVTGSASGHWTWNGGSPVTVGRARRSRASHANTACRCLPLCRPTAFANLARSGRVSVWLYRATCRLRRKVRRHTLLNPKRAEAFTW